MVVTSVVTYTFPIGPFLGAPSSRYGPSVDWGAHYLLLMSGASRTEDLQQLANLPPAVY